MQVVKVSESKELPKKIFNICLVLTSFFVLAGSILSFSLSGIHKDMQSLQVFLASAESVKPNFEESLSLYTQGTREAFDYLKDLRPSSEEEYIRFISSVEDIAKELSLNINFVSIGAITASTNVGETLNYRVQFYGGPTDLLSFLERVEALPYFVRIYKVNYKSLSLNGVGGDAVPNIDLTIQLYVK